MNKVEETGRLTRDPEVKVVSQGEKTNKIARYTLAVARRWQGSDQKADFINIVAYGKAAEFAEKYFRKGMKVGVTGRIQTGSYTNKDGIKVYTNEVVAEEQEFEEKKHDAQTAESDHSEAAETDENGFIQVPEGADENYPFEQ